MRRVLLIVLFISLFIGLVHGEYFEKGGKYLTGQIDLNVVTRPFSKPFGVSFGYGIFKNIEAGVTLMIHFRSGSSNYTPSLDLFYHFTNPKKPLILFAGLSAGYDYFKSGFGWSSERSFIFPVLGARYFFNKKIAVSLKLARSFSEYLGSQLLLGVALSL